MSQKYSVQVIEGEMDEDEEELAQEVPEAIMNKQVSSPKQDDQPIRNPSVEDLKTVQEIKEYLVEHRKEDVRRLEERSESLMKGQGELLEEIEKTKLNFYDAEFVEIQETFMMLPEYMKKVKEIQRIMGRLKNVVQAQGQKK